MQIMCYLGKVADFQGRQIQQIGAHRLRSRPHSISGAKGQQLNQLIDCGTRQNSRLKPCTQCDDTIGKMSLLTPSRGRNPLAAPSRHLKDRSCLMRRPRLIWGIKSRHQKNSSLIEIFAIHRNKVSVAQSSLRFSYLIIRAFRTRNQSSEVQHLKKSMCSAVILGL